MKTFKLLIISALLVITACKDNKEKEAQVNEETEEVQITVDPDKVRYAEVRTSKDTFGGNAYPIDWDSIEVDDKLRPDLQSWKELTSFETTLGELQNVPKKEFRTYGERLKAEAENLTKTIPESLQTPAVKEDIQAVNKEVARLKTILDKQGVNEEEIGKQVSQMVEALNQLGREINETIRRSSALLKDNS